MKKKPHETAEMLKLLIPLGECKKKNVHETAEKLKMLIMLMILGTMGPPSESPKRCNP